MAEDTTKKRIITTPGESEGSAEKRGKHPEKKTGVTARIDTLRKKTREQLTHGAVATSAKVSEATKQARFEAAKEKYEKFLTWLDGEIADLEEQITEECGPINQQPNQSK